MNKNLLNIILLIVGVLLLLVVLITNISSSFLGALLGFASVALIGRQIILLIRDN